MRIVIVDTYYPAFLREHYEREPGLERRPYREQLDSLMSRFFGTSDAYSHHLRELGHDAIEIVPNCSPLQMRWAAENGRPGRLRRARARLPRKPRARPTLAGDPLLQEIAIAQIEAHEADVVYAQDLHFFTRPNLDLLRRQGRLLAGQIATEWADENLVKGFDLILTSFPHYVERFRALGVGSEKLQIGFYERVLDRLRRDGVDPSPGAFRPHGIAFVGGLEASQHIARAELLEQIASRMPLEFWGYGSEKLADDSALRLAYRGQAWGIEMSRVLAESRIVINRHGEVSEGYANNMRLFETTGTGALLMTEAAPNLTDYFEPGREVVSYDDPEDLMGKLAHYLEHDDERISIAAAGQARTLRDHTYARVMASLAGTLEARLP